MRKMMFLAPVAASCLALSACGYSVFDAADDVSRISSGGMEDGQPIPAQAITLAQFDEIAAVGPDSIRFTTGPQFSIRAEAPADLLSHLRYKMEDGGLQIGRENGSWKGTGGATIYVTAPSLKSLSAIGSGSVDVDRMHGDGVEINNAGSGSVCVADVQAANLDLSLAGSGDVMLAGKAGNGDISIAGSGDVDGSGLTIDKGDVSIAGSGNVRLRSDGMIDASIMGSGDVTVQGSAKCDVSAMGSGKLHCGG